ncbi:MAG: hypothetical protein ACKN9T_14405 [Candidatus Methylumidiphilus sp.]
MYPIQPTLEITKILLDVAFANNEGNRKLREKEVDTQLEQYRIQERSYIKEREIEERMHRVAAQKEVELSRISAQKEVTLVMADLAKHAFDRKMDFFCASFGEVLQAIKWHKQLLAEEKKALDMKQWTVGLSIPETIQIRKRAEQISIDLINLDAMLFEITKDYNQKISALAPEVKLSLPRF